MCGCFSLYVIFSCMNICLQNDIYGHVDAWHANNLPWVYLVVLGFVCVLCFSINNAAVLGPFYVSMKKLCIVLRLPSSRY
jgi:hypothetical protein